MIIKKLSAKSFGKLKDINIEFTPGMNIIYGPNESGKSTIQAFIKGMFYGLDKKGKKDSISEYDRYLPWNNSDYAGIIEYQEGKLNYRVGRNFITNKVSVCNEFWDDITNKFPIDKKRGPLFAQSHLGITEKCFEKTIFIRQLESKIKDDGKEILDKLINIQESGQEDISFKNAAEILENTLREKIGNDKSIKKPLNIIESQIQALEKEKSEVIFLRNQVLELEQTINTKESQKKNIIDKIEGYKSIKDSIKKESLIDLYNKAKQYENDIERIENEIGRLKMFDNFPVHLENELKDLLTQIKNLNDILEEKRLDLEEIEQKINKVKQSCEDMDQSRQSAYTAISDFDTLQNIQKEIEECKAQINCHLEQGELESSQEQEDVGANEVEIDNLNLLSQLVKEAVKVEEDEQKAFVKVLPDEDRVLYVHDIQKITDIYNELINCKYSLEPVQTEIEKIEQEIAQADTLLFDLKGFSNLPDDIENKIVKLEDTLSESSSSIERGTNVHKSSKIRLIIKSLFWTFAIALLSYGIYCTSIVPGITSYLTIGAGLLLSAGIAFERKLFKNFYYKKNVRPKYQKSNQKSITSKEYDELMNIYKTVGINDFTQFIKGLYDYRDASNKISMLSLELDNKNKYYKDIENKINNLQQNLSEVLAAFDISHKLDEISDVHISMLKERFNSLVSIYNKDMVGINCINYFTDLKKNISDKILDVLSCNTDNINAQEIIDILDKQKHKSYISFKETFEKMKDFIPINQKNTVINNDVGTSHIDHLNNKIIKLNEQAELIEGRIKSILNQYNIKFVQSSVITQDEINELKVKITEITQQSSELLGLNAIRESILKEITKKDESLCALKEEKDEILKVSMTINEEEFLMNCDKNRNLNILIEERNKAYNIYNELLNGENSEDILKKAADLNVNIVSDVCDVSIEDAESNMDILDNQLKELEQEIISLKSEAQNKLQGRMDLNSIIEQIEWLKAEKERLKFNKLAIETAVEVLKEASKEIQKDFSPKFQIEVSSIISEITDGRYKEANTNEKLSINVVDPESGQIVPADKLSIGTIEQLYLALRIALSNVLSEGRQKLPLIIDEAFVQYDDLRIKNVMKFLFEFAQERQIIIFTCQRREIDILEDLRLREKVNIIELN